MTPDGSHVVVSSYDEGTLQLWSLETRMELRRFTSPSVPMAFNHLKFDHRGRYFMTFARLEDPGMGTHLFDSGARASQPVINALWLPTFTGLPPPSSGCAFEHRPTLTHYKPDSPHARLPFRYHGRRGDKASSGTRA
jgi:WD40 repeat protein